MLYGAWQVPGTMAIAVASTFIPFSPAATALE
eukprot:SAG31_NODE_43810_length_265_cov_0.933735_1_plen_31_part_01